MTTGAHGAMTGRVLPVMRRARERRQLLGKEDREIVQVTHTLQMEGV